MKLLSKRRLVSTTVGVLISIALIFSMFTVSNNAVKSQIYERVMNEPYDFGIYGPLPARNYSKVMRGIENLSHVKWVRGFIYAPMQLGNQSETITVGYWENISDTVKLIQGRLPFYSDEIAVSYWYARTYNISVGTNLNVTVYPNGTMENVTYFVVGIYYPKDFFYHCDAVGTPAGVSKYGNPLAMIVVKLDPHYLLSSLDMNEINRKIWTVRSEALNVFYSYGGENEANSNVAYTEYGNPLLAMEYLVYALPIIVMGVYLSKIGIEIELTERRREFGIIRVRGGGRKYEVRVFLRELLAYSIIGGLGGYLVGELMAHAGNNFIYRLPYFALDWGIGYALIGVFLGLLMFIIAFYSPWKRIKRTPIVELISHFSTHFSRVKYEPIRDAVASFALWGYLIVGLFLIENTSFTGGLSVMVVLAEIIAMSFVFMLPVILVLLPLFMSRLFTLGTQKIYIWIVKPLTRIMKVSREIVEYGVERNPKNMAYVAFMLAFVLTFSSLVSSSQDSQIELSHLQQVQAVGGDFEVSTHQYAGSVSILEALSESPNQSAHVWIAYGGGTIFGDDVSVYFGNYLNYTSSVYELDKFLYRGAFKSNRVVISRSLAIKFGLNVGDTVSVNMYDEGYASPGISQNHGIKEYQISGIVYSFPGLSYAEDAIFIDSHVSPANSTTLILKARNYHALEEQLKMVGVSYQARSDAAGQENAMFFQTTEMFLVILGGATIAIVNYSLYYNRRGEIALYRVRGARRGQIRALLMAEGAGIIFLSLIIGVSVGLMLSYFLVEFQLSSTELPGSFVVGYNFGVVTVVMVVVFLSIQYALSTLFARTNSAEVIRANGGEM
ncbi:MAG: FtsX-like permease family protein [Euryarchaeota archaeon]|nr:FtsX-like permease family protein [Euryarchaeota archaeon]